MSEHNPPVIAVLHAGDLPPVVPSPAEIRYATADELPEALKGAEILLLWDQQGAGLRAAWPAADTLRWAHANTAGVDNILFPELVDSDVVLTNSRGIFDRPIAEFVLGAVLALAKDLPTSMRLQQEHTWRHRTVDTVHGCHALVVGTGPIGRAIARMLNAAGLHVTGVGRTARDGDPDFGTVHASSQLAEVAADTDYLILAAPLTPQTRGMVDGRVLTAMRPSARLINVGRGELVHTDDLVTALRAKKLAGAALDVVDPEPLPAGHPLWDLDNVLITPHHSGDSRAYEQELAQMFTANFRRYVTGEPLHNVVDKQRGYVPG